MEVPQHCPGVESQIAGKASACAGCPNQGICSEGKAKGTDSDSLLVKSRTESVKNKILVVSGKGGVGKSSFSSLLARHLAKDINHNVAILDIDICGPSMPRIMGLLDERIHQSGSGWSPVYAQDNLSVMSIGFLLPSADDAVIWRGPRKNGMIRQFLCDVDWGQEVEYLIIDTPPGTSDEHLSITQYLKELPNVSAIVVTTPHKISLLDARKEIDFLKKVGIPIIGVVENMSRFSCPNCKRSSEMFPSDSGGAAQMSQEAQVPYLGSLPYDRSIAKNCDEGTEPEEYSPEICQFFSRLESVLVENFSHVVVKK